MYQEKEEFLKYKFGYTLPAPSRKAVLYFHGFCSSPMEGYLLGSFLQEKGYNFIGVLAPGHGYDCTTLAKINYSDWLTFAKQKYEEVKKDYDEVSVIGFSMGGLLASYIAENYHDIHRLVLLAPAFKHKFPLTGIGSYLYPIVPYLKFFGSVHYEDGAEFFFRYGVPGKCSVRAANQLTRCMSFVKKDLKKIDAPLLLAQGKKDEVVSQKIKKIIFKRVSSQNKEYISYPNRKHVLPLENGKYEMFEDIYKFLKK